MATQFLEEFDATTKIPVHVGAGSNNGKVGVGVVSGKLYVNLSGTVTEVGTGSTGLQANASTNLILRTAVLTNTVRLNSITDTTSASGDLIGFQSKPRSGVSGTQNVYGCQISAQVSDAVALSSGGSVIGGHIDVYLRGTSAGAIAGDVRGLQIELTTDDAGTRDISGYVTGLRIRMAFSAGTVTGIRSAIRVESPEAQTNSETYDALFDLTNSVAGVWNANPGTEPTTADGYIKVRIEGANRYIQLYSGAPVD